MRARVLTCTNSAHYESAEFQHFIKSPKRLRKNDEAGPYGERGRQAP